MLYIVTFPGIELRIKGKAEFSWSETKDDKGFDGKEETTHITHTGEETYLKSTIKLLGGKYAFGYVV